jgi:hypothetical protein
LDEDAARDAQWTAAAVAALLSSSRLDVGGRDVVVICPPPGRCSPAGGDALAATAWRYVLVARALSSRCLCPNVPA